MMMTHDDDARTPGGVKPAVMMTHADDARMMTMYSDLTRMLMTHGPRVACSQPEVARIGA